MMKILFAGGGTAGHIEPALAVARGWKERHPEDEILFIGTDSGLENHLIPAAGFTLLHIPKVSIARRISPSLLKVPFQLVSAIIRTCRIIDGVDCAIGFGGYVSAPMYCAAAITRTPFVIHEQNARPGWANRVGAWLTAYRAISYPVAEGVLSRAELTGLPLRADVRSALIRAKSDWAAAREEAKRAVARKYGFDASRKLIFIFGGSQGSQAINQVIEKSEKIFSKHGCMVIHGVGKNNSVAASSENYQQIHYIDEMAEMYLAADLLISRSGAVTCAEATALSRYSLFIPLPIGNGEQAFNAQELVTDGRAELIDQQNFSVQWLESNLARLLERSAAQPESGDASRMDAVDKILSMIERAAKK
jgi:UDP-N-acetylglucosamine--N-acetylmuramyl-(pentapeptide) pyrophosphoryl-undecaprenol N-acetylglucosamine transferase